MHELATSLNILKETLPQAKLRNCIRSLVVNVFKGSVYARYVFIGEIIRFNIILKYAKYF